MLRNFVLEKANAPGTSSTVNLAGALTGRRAFVDEFASGAAALYFMDDGSQQEAGIGTFTAGSPNTLSRSTVLWNSSVGRTSPGRLNFAGSVLVYNAVPSERSLFLDANGRLGVGTETPWWPIHNYSASADVWFAADAPAAHNKGLLLASSGSLRWIIYSSATTDDLYFNRYDDSGNAIDSPFSIARSTGVANFAHGVSIGNNLFVANGLNVAASGATIAGGLTLSSGTLTISSGGMNVAGGLTLSSGALTISSGGMNVSGFATFNSGATVNNSLFVGSGGASITGGLTVFNALHVASGNAQFDAGASVFNSLVVASGTLTVSAGSGYVQGGLTVDNSLHMASGTFTADGFAALNQGATISNALLVNGGGTLNGNFAFNGSNTQTGDFFVHSGAVISDGRGFSIGSYFFLNSGGTGSSGGGTFTYGFTTNNRMSAAEFNAFSDSRAKDKKRPITREMGLTFARQVTPITWEWNGLAACADAQQGEVQSGYIAQQCIAAGFAHMTSASLNAKMPETVETFDGVEVRSIAGVEMHVNYSEATPYLHVALLDALDRIAALETRLAAAGLA